MQRAYLSSDASRCACSFAEGAPPPGRNRRHVFCAALALGESGASRVTFPVPLVVGSGKSGTPCLRMQAANSIAWAMGSREEDESVVVVVEPRWATLLGGEP